MLLTVRFRGVKRFEKRNFLTKLNVATTTTTTTTTSTTMLELQNLSVVADGGAGDGGDGGGVQRICKDEEREECDGGSLHTRYVRSKRMQFQVVDVVCVGLASFAHCSLFALH